MKWLMAGALLNQLLDLSDATTAFLERATSPSRVDDSYVTSAISSDEVGAILKKLKRGKAAGPDKINNCFLP